MVEVHASVPGVVLGVTVTIYSAFHSVTVALDYSVHTAILGTMRAAREHTPLLQCLNCSPALIGPTVRTENAHRRPVANHGMQKRIAQLISTSTRKLLEWLTDASVRHPLMMMTQAQIFMAASFATASVR